ncbi:MAG: hypothetical protein KOO66_09995 [Bacteroidales bacterium]|nr:hypothetical protein [Bacteroidales bacterium]
MSKKYFLYQIIAKEKELEYWYYYVRNNKWLQEYIETNELKEILEGKPDKRKWTDSQWQAYMMSLIK